MHLWGGLGGSRGISESSHTKVCLSSEAVKTGGGSGYGSGGGGTSKKYELTIW